MLRIKAKEVKDALVILRFDLPALGRDALWSGQNL